MYYIDNSYELTKEAYKNGEFHELLTGEGYQIPVIGCPANVPTDFVTVVKRVYQLYDEFSDPKIITDFENAIERMLNGTDTEVWMAAYILFNVISHEKKGDASFFIDESIFVDFSNAVSKNKNKLCKNTAYGNGGFSYGLYEDILRLNYNLQEKLAISLI